MSRGRSTDLGDRVFLTSCMCWRPCRLTGFVCKTREGPCRSMVICDTEAHSRTLLESFKEKDS